MKKLKEIVIETDGIMFTERRGLDFTNTKEDYVYNLSGFVILIYPFNKFLDNLRFKIVKLLYWKYFKRQELPIEERFSKYTFGKKEAK